MGKVEERFNQRRQQRAQKQQFTEISRMVEATAKVAHEVNRGYCEALVEEVQPPWEEALEWQQESAMRWVIFYMNKPEAGPEESHYWWMNEKKQDGWVYGVEKSEENKTHPWLIPFEQLPKEQQAVHFMFKSVVHAMVNGGYHGK